MSIPEKIFWNGMLLLLGIALSFFAIQHAVFFYSWPPDISRWTDVPIQTYFMLGLMVYIVLKASHLLEEASQVVEEEDSDD